MRDGMAVPSDDLVNRHFRVEGADRLWVMDVTEHPTGIGKVYLATVLDAWSRTVVGWSVADHIRSELVLDALQMAIWRRQADRPGHCPFRPRLTSWAFGRRLRAAGLLGSMGSVGDAYDNSVAEGFFGTRKLELLDTRAWPDRDTLAGAIFEWIEAWSTHPPAHRRRHAEPHRLRTTNRQPLTAA